MLNLINLSLRTAIPKPCRSLSDAAAFPLLLTLLLAGCGGSSAGAPDNATNAQSPDAASASATALDSVASQTPEPAPIESDPTADVSASVLDDTAVEVESPQPVSGSGTEAPEGELSILNTNNANAVIMQAFEVFTGRAYDRRLTAYPYVKQAPSLTPENNALAGHFYYDMLACDNGGEKSEESYDTGTGWDTFKHYDTTYTNCSIGSEILNGRAILSADFCCYHGYKMEFSNNFSVAFGGAGIMELSGIYNNDRTVSVENFNYRLSYSGGSLTISDATTNGLSGSFRMTPPILGSDSVQVTIDETFDNNESATMLAYSQGSMRITADDSEIVLSANNADPDTVTLTITARGETSTRTEPWSSWLQALSFIPSRMGQDLFTPSVDGDGIMTGERFGAKILDLPDYPYPTYPIEELYGLSGFGTEIFEICDNGGDVSSWPFRWGYREETRGWQSEFNNCTKGNKTYNGNFSTRSTFTTYFSNGLTVSEGSASSTFKGVMKYKTRAYYGDSPWPTYHYILEDVYLDSTASSDPYALSEATLSYSTKNNRESAGSQSTMRGRFSLATVATGQNTIRVVTPANLIFDHPEGTHSTYGAVVEPGGVISIEPADEILTTSSATSDSGILYIDAGNGNELYLHAGTGDSETFRVTIYQAGQAPVVTTERWQDWQLLFRFNYDLRDR